MHINDKTGNTIFQCPVSVEVSEGFRLTIESGFLLKHTIFLELNMAMVVFAILSH